MWPGNKGHEEQVGLSEAQQDYRNNLYKGRYPAEEGLLPHGDPSKEDAARAVKTAGAFVAGVKAVLA